MLKKRGLDDDLGDVLGLGTGGSMGKGRGRGSVLPKGAGGGEGGLGGGRMGSGLGGPQTSAALEIWRDNGRAGEGGVTRCLLSLFGSLAESGESLFKRAILSELSDSQSSHNMESKADQVAERMTKQVCWFYQ